jgi:hypothetical protein
MVKGTDFFAETSSLLAYRGMNPGFDFEKMV